MPQNNTGNEVFEIKESESQNYESGRISKKVLKFMYSANRELRIDEIKSGTGLTKKKIWRNLLFLKGLGAITSRKEIIKIEGKPPQRHLLVSLSKSQVKNARRYLKKNDLL